MSMPLVRRHPVAAYFVLTFAISWSGALLVAAPQLIRHEPLSNLTGILMFPAMLFGPSIGGIAMAAWWTGRARCARCSRGSFAGNFRSAGWLPF